MNQRERIRAVLVNGGTITALQAFKHFGCLRLAARINELRNEGMRIVAVLVYRNGKRFAQYRLRP